MADIVTTITEAFKQLPKEKAKWFPFRGAGVCYAPTKKKCGRVTIGIPVDVMKESITELDDWFFAVVAIDRTEFNRLQKELPPGKNYNGV